MLLLHALCCFPVRNRPMSRYWKTLVSVVCSCKYGAGWSVRCRSFPAARIPRASLASLSWKKWPKKGRKSQGALRVVNGRDPFHDPALQEQIQGCNFIPPTFSMTVPAVQFPLTWAGRAPPGPPVGLYWDGRWYFDAGVKGKGTWGSSGGQEIKWSPKSHCCSCGCARMCSLDTWCHFDSGNVLLNPFKRYVMGCVHKCSCIKVHLWPLSSWYCFRDVFWGAGCWVWAVFPSNIDQNDDFCCASRCHFQLCKVVFFLFIFPTVWICGKIRKRLLHSPDAFCFDAVLQRVCSPQRAAWCVVLVRAILLGLCWTTVLSRTSKI